MARPEEDCVVEEEAGTFDGPLMGKDYFFITAQPENAPDKLSAVECWSLASDFAQIARIFRNSFIASGTLAFVGDSFLAGAAIRKPWISVWPFNQPIPLQPPLLTPLPVTAMALSPDGEYLLVAIGSKLHFYQVSTGDFLILLARHYQPVSAVAFSPSGRQFASAGMDGVLFVWKTAEIVSSSRDQVPNPQTVSCQSRVESLVFARTDVSSSYLICVGKDHTCRIFDTATASQGPLGTFVFRRPLIAVTADYAVTSLAVSDDSGDIFRLPLITESFYNTLHVLPSTNFVGRMNFPGPVQTGVHRLLGSSLRSVLVESPAGAGMENRSSQGTMISEVEWNQRHKFAGHRNTTRCLQFSGDGSLLVSGSDDATVRIWQVKSRICVRVLQFKGPVTNLLRCRNPNALFSKRNLSLGRPIMPLKKQLFGESGNPDKPADLIIPPRAFTWTGVPVPAFVPSTPDGVSDSSATPESELFEPVSDDSDLTDRKANASLVAQLREREHEIQSLKNVNHELYEFARDTVLKLHPS